MSNFHLVIVALSLVGTLPVVAQLRLPLESGKRQDEVPLKNWSAPAYWQSTPDRERQEISVIRAAALNPEVSLPTQPLVFVGMTPCRVVDTRVNAGFPAPFGPPSLIFEAKRTFPIQSSTRCSIPTTALAYSFNVTVTPVTTPGINPPGYLGYLTLYPTGGALPNAST